MELVDGLIRKWERVGDIQPDQLVPSRKELHRAAQFPAALGRSLGRSQPQQVHRTLRFEGSVGALVSRESASTGVYLGLATAEGRLVFVGPGGGVIGTLWLEGRTRGEIWEWIERLLDETGTDGRVLDRDHPEYELANHPVDAGKPFRLAHQPACAELSRHLANAHRVLSAVGTTQPRATPVRTWPDQMETSLFTHIDPRKRLGRGEFVEYGFSAGDGSYEEPYWYVIPHPRPDREQLSALESRGFWHRKQWVGAVLPVSRLYGADDQLEVVTEFLNECAEIAEELIDGREPARRGAE